MAQLEEYVHSAIPKTHTYTAYLCEADVAALSGMVQCGLTTRIASLLSPSKQRYTPGPRNPFPFPYFNSVQTRCIVKGEAQISPLFWRLSGGLGFSQELLFSKEFHKKTFKFNKIPDFYKHSL